MGGVTTWLPLHPSCPTLRILAAALRHFKRQMANPTEANRCWLVYAIAAAITSASRRSSFQCNELTGNNGTCTTSHRFLEIK